MSYSKTTWQDLPNTSTPINKTRLNNMENGIADANGMIGVNTYSSSSTYAVGDYCVYDNKLYRCKTAIATAEAFTSSKWQQVSTMTEIRDAGVVVSATTPTGNNKNKIWIKKSKNLFDINNYTIIGGKIAFDISNLKIGTTYTVSSNNTIKTFKISTSSSSYNSVIASNITQYTFQMQKNSNIGADKVQYLFLNVGDSFSENIDDFSGFNIQIEQSSTATTYEDYIEPEIYIKNTNAIYEKFETKHNEMYSLNEEKIGTWLGKPLYRKVIDFGALPNTTYKSLNHNISNIDTIATLQGVATYTTNGAAYPIPFSSSDPTNNIALTANNTAITITTGSNRSAITKCYVILEYTKTTD